MSCESVSADEAPGSEMFPYCEGFQFFVKLSEVFVIVRTLRPLTDVTPILGQPTLHFRGLG